MKNEPLLTAGGIGAAAAAILGVLVAFGVDLTEAQQAAILGVVAVLAPVVVALVARHLVTPNGKVVELVRGDDVVAGPANEIPDGAVVRKLRDFPTYE